MIIHFRWAYVVFACCLLLGSTSYSHAQSEWSSFQNGGNSTSDVQLPLEWSPDAGVKWSAELAGYGQSSPVLYNDAIYISSVKGDNKETLNIQSISAKTGEQQWMFNHANSSPEANTMMVSRAAPTPVVDSEGVITFFEGGNLIALGHDGSLRWKRDLREELGELKARHGLAASLEQNDENIFLWAERMEEPFIMSIAKKDGKTNWKKPGVGSTSWSSPRMVEVNGNDHLVLSAIGKIVGLDPTSGDELWNFDKISGNSSATPVPVGDGRFLIGASGGREGGPSVPSCGVIEIEKNSDGFAASWKWVADRASCSFGSPFAFQNRAYFVNRSGIVQCFQLDSGKELFTSRLPAGPIWATPLASKGHVYFFGKSGVTSVVAPADQLMVVAENRLWKSEDAPQGGAAGAQSGPVLYAAANNSHGELYVRRGDKLYALASPNQ